MEEARIVNNLGTSEQAPKLLIAVVVPSPLPLHYLGLYNESLYDFSNKHLYAAKKKTTNKKDGTNSRMSFLLQDEANRTRCNSSVLYVYFTPTTIYVARTFLNFMHDLYDFTYILHCPIQKSRIIYRENIHTTIRIVTQIL